MFNSVKRYLKRSQAEHLAKHAKSPWLRDYAAKLPLDHRAKVRDLRFVAIDIETTGLDARIHEILSIGTVDIEGFQIRSESARHWWVKPRGRIEAQSVNIHGITESQLANAPYIEEVVPEVMAHLSGAVLLAHNASIERDFLAAAIRQVEDVKVPFTMADTLIMERAKLFRQNIPINRFALQLDTVMQRYNLLQDRSHDALSDALGCAQVALALFAHTKMRSQLDLRAIQWC